MSSRSSPDKRRLPQTTMAVSSQVIDADGASPFPESGWELQDPGRVRAAITYLVFGVLIVAAALIISATIGQAVAHANNPGAMSTVTILVDVLILCGVLVALVGGGYHLVLAFMHVRVASLSVKQVEQQLLHAEERLAMERQRQALEEHLARTRLPADDNGNRPFIYDELSHTVLEITAGQYKQPVPSSIHWNYHDTSTRLTEDKSPQIASQLQLPPPCDMKSIMRQFDLSPDNLFLALAKGDRPITCTLEDFMHVAHDAPTGKGKTVQWYTELVQLLMLQVQVVLCNPHFAPIDKKGRDWRPIGKAIEAQGRIEIAPGAWTMGLLYEYKLIAALFAWLSLKEIDRRYQLQLAGDFSFAPLYIFVDELAGVIEKYPETAGYMTDVLRRGRAVEVCVDANSQGFLASDVDMSKSISANFNTAYHMGGSEHSAARVLDITIKKYNEMLKAEHLTAGELGRGVALLRNAVTCPAQLVRLPYADNEYARYFLGDASDWVPPQIRNNGETGSKQRRNTEDLRNRVETDETAPEAEGNDVFRAFSVSEESQNPRIDTSSVLAETRETIKRLYNNGQGMRLREIAPKVKLAGDKYKIFQAVCREIGIEPKKERL